MKCSLCHHWILVRKTIYDDGSEVLTWTVPSGKGHCTELDIDTFPSFGCIQFDPATNHHEIVTVKTGEPWQYHHDIPCPDCKGTGCVPDTVTINRWACHRCCGTGRVRKYDDGYIGEEKTRMHPKEKELRAKGEPLPGTVLQPIEKPDVADTGGVL